MDFKIGMVVICVNNKSLHQSRLSTNAPPLKLHGKYIVQGVKECSCGAIAIDVGLVSQTGAIICYKCNGRTLGTIWWCSSLRFSPEKTEEEIRIEYKVVEIDKSVKEKRKEVLFNN